MVLVLLACREPAPVRSHPTPPPPGVLRDCPPAEGVICPWAGSGSNGWNGDDASRLDVWLSFPMDVAFPLPGPGRRPVIADWNNHVLRAVNETDLEGLETVVHAHLPSGVTFFPDGRLLAATDSRLLVWDPDDGASTFLGQDWRGFARDPDGLPVDFDGPADEVAMSNPSSPEIDPTDPTVVYYIDQANGRVRRYDTAAGRVDTVLGETVDASGDGQTGTPGYCGQGDALATCLGFPSEWITEPFGAIAVGADGETLYVSDSGNQVIWQVDLQSERSSILSGQPGVRGMADGPVADALWSAPVGLALDLGTGELFVADAENNRVRAIDLAAGTVSTVAGTGEPSCPSASGSVETPDCAGLRDGGDGGLAVDATLYQPFGVDLDPDGNLLISDTYDQRIRIVYRNQ